MFGVVLTPGITLADPTFFENIKKANADDPRAQYRVSLAYAYGQGTDKNSDEAMYWYCKAPAQGNASAQYNYGYAFHWGVNAPQIHKEAAKWFLLSADQSQITPIYYMATYYWQGLAVPKDLIESYKWLYVSLARAKLGNLRSTITGLKQKVSDEI